MRHANVTGEADHGNQAVGDQNCPPNRVRHVIRDRDRVVVDVSEAPRSRTGAIQKSDLPRVRSRCSAASAAPRGRKDRLPRKVLLDRRARPVRRGDWRPRPAKKVLLCAR